VEPIEITCIICGAAFEFGVDEQLRFEKMNFDEPRRCPDCRKKKLRTPDFQDKKYYQKRRLYQSQFKD
jgi:DNA-directed RNA polymerase subunit RPC12/RpoP